MSLDNIGFYTLSNTRAQNASPSSPMWRCELIVTTRCNFHCGYCRGPAALPVDCREDLPESVAQKTLSLWIDDGLRNVRFSGGEPTLYEPLLRLVKQCSSDCVEHIAISTNGSASQALYDKLIDAGVNDLSVSLDACCAAHGDRLANTPDSWHRVVDTLRHLASRAYVTVGVVVTEETAGRVADTVAFAHDLGVADIRLVSAAQYNEPLWGLERIPRELLAAHPILRYRIEHFLSGRNVRGIEEYDCHRCYLAIDDSVVAGGFHFPCVIYMREGGSPLGLVNSEMRQVRTRWAQKHDTFDDPICRANCLDVCIDYNNYYAANRRHREAPS